MNADDEYIKGETVMKLKFQGKGRAIGVLNASE